MSKSPNPTDVAYHNDADKSQFHIATANSRKTVRWKNVKISWNQLLAKLKQTVRTNETVREYHASSKTDQAEKKDIGGFVGGYLIEGRRLKRNVDFRSFLTLDADFADTDTWVRYGRCCPDVAAAVYSTHSHRKEAPKLRIIVPLSRKVNPYEYQALSRMMAQRIGIEQFDPTTHAPERLMYWPSTPKDGDFIFETQDGAWLDVDEVLGSYQDWTDTSEWPTSERETAVVEKERNKALLDDPRKKNGAVGAFCRAYSISQAIEKFLKDRYRSSGDGRYSYAKSRSVAGLVVYDDTFATSHHATDPVCGRTVNAFDLVRLHLFGDLDVTVEPNTPINRMPSFIKMRDSVWEDAHVRFTIGKERLSEALNEFSSFILKDCDECGTGAGALEKKLAEAEANAGWLELLKFDKKTGKYEPTIDNVIVILENDPLLNGRFKTNLFSGKKEVVGGLPWRPPIRKGYGDSFTDEDASALLNYLEKFYGLGGQAKMEHALNVVFQHNSYHPIRNYLEKLSWDGTARLGTLFINFMGVVDTEYARAVTTKMMVAAVARVMNPGCKFDHVLVLVGPEGIGKSTIFKILGGLWFSDSFNTVQGKEAVEALDGAWILEMGELAGMKKADVNTIKHFISKTNDAMRPAYGRHVKDVPRQCVFVATTNEEDFLRGTNGNRRFWPLLCGVEDTLFDLWGDLEGEVRDQLWAEALTLYKAGETLHLSKEMEEIARRIQTDHSEKDDRMTLIEAYLDKALPENWYDLVLSQRRSYINGDTSVFSGSMIRDKICVREVWEECFGQPASTLHRGHSMTIAAILMRLEGWERSKGNLKIPGYGKQRAYRRTSESTDELRKLLDEKPPQRDDSEAGSNWDYEDGSEPF